MECKSIYSASQRKDFGPCNISSNYISKTEIRENYTKLWDDNYIVGTLYSLHKYATKNSPLAYKEIGEIIGWEWRTIKNAMWSLKKSESSLLKDTIKTVKFHVPCFHYRCRYKYYIDESFITNMDLKRLIKLFYRCYYGKDNPNTPNYCESCILEICNFLYPNQFLYTGTQTTKNRVGRYYPDISHVEHKIIIEHNGSPFHQNKKKEKERSDYLKSLGYYILIITDYTDNKKEQITKQIKEFVDNAIQDIYKLVV